MPGQPDQSSHQRRRSLVQGRWFCVAIGGFTAPEKLEKAAPPGAAASLEAPDKPEAGTAPQPELNPGTNRSKAPPYQYAYTTASVPVPLAIGPRLSPDPPDNAAAPSMSADHLGGPPEPTRPGPRPSIDQLDP
jgi:hypothetical protein